MNPALTPEEQAALRTFVQRGETLLEARERGADMKIAAHSVALALPEAMKAIDQAMARAQREAPWYWRVWWVILDLPNRLLRRYLTYKLGRKS